jgi:hypothetical protein
MEYIERYLHQIQRLLPEKEREDVARELREILEEEVNAKQAGDLSPQVLEKNQLDVLKKFGAPESIAIEYGGGYSPLVPAELMPQFIRVLKVLGIIYVLVFIIRSFFADHPFSELNGFISNAFINFAIVVLIFYFIGRDKKNLKSDWKPESLPPVQATAEVNQAELLSGIAFNSFIVISVLLSPEWIESFAQDTQVMQWDITIAKIRVYIPFAIFIVFGNILLSMATLVQRVWTPVLRAGNMALDLLWILLAATALTFGLEFSFAAAFERIPEKFVDGSWIVGSILVGSIVIALIDMVSHGIKWATNKS